MSSKPLTVVAHLKAFLGKADLLLLLAAPPRIMLWERIA
jgi:hypothetical protein